MGFIHYLLMLSCMLPCIAELSDNMHVYEDECLGEDRMFCADGSCVWKQQYCDGKLDCPDGSDENLCVDHTPDPELCASSGAHYLCEDKKKCIPDTWICNKETDCEDGSDEANCTTVQVNCTSSEHFECADKSGCIPNSRVCNSLSDCDDSSDEANCTIPIPQSALPNNGTACRGFTCKSDKRCISLFWVCDGAYDCADQSDESVDLCRRPSVFRGTCPEDGIAGLPYNITRFFKKFYLCRDESECLNSNRMCDGTIDCKDGSDEEDFCDTWYTMCLNKTCNGKAICRPERNGEPTCECLVDYQLYNQTTHQCEPVDACGMARPQCSHTCINGTKFYGFACRCEDGYISENPNNNFKCFAPDPEAMLFFTTPNEVKYITLKSKKIVTIATGVKQAHGVAFDGTFVYWVETAQGHQAIVRAPLDNVADTKTVLVGLGLEDPGDISIDFIGGNFYFSDAQRGTISACNIQTQLCTTINTDTRVPKHLTLDIKNGKMYWADYHERPVIMSAWMDGSAASALVPALLAPAAGLAVDAPGARLYYIDGTLKGARLDTGLAFTVNPRVPMFHEPRALTVFENSIYWSDWASNTIQNWRKQNGESFGPLLTLDSPVYGVHIFHPILTRVGRSPALANCSHLRLVGPGDRLVCACPDGLELDDTRLNCRPMKSYRPEYVVVGSESTFTRVQYNAVGGQPSVAVPFDIGHVQAMAYDTQRDVLYIYDSLWKAISTVSMSDFHLGSATMTWFMGLDNVVDMDYDYITDNLYILDAGRKFVEAISLRTGKMAVIYKFEHEIPRSLCVIPEYGKMFIAVSENEQDDTLHIDSLGLDGSSQQHLIMNNLKGPHVRLKFSRKMDAVYIADEGNNMIDYLHPEGTGLENFRELSTFVTELAVTDTLVLWTTRRSHRLYWADIHDASRNIRRVELSMFPNTADLHIQATWQPSNVSAHPCQSNPCSDVCVQTPRYSAPDYLNIVRIHYGEDESKLLSGFGEPDSDAKLGYRCLCPPGLAKVDGKCSELASCREDQAYCHLSNVCIEDTKRCDGNKDCEHGEDEEGCNGASTVPLSKCKPDEKLCVDMCIDKHITCVITSTAATTTTTEGVCYPTEFACSSSYCVERSRLCDGERDCPDGADEYAALCDTLTCRHTEFTCSSGQCILEVFKCDGEVDCKDGSDEFSCVNKTCPPHQYQCRNLQCIDMTRRCDAQQDCADYSDEDNCVYFIDALFPEPDKEETEPENCPEWEYACELNRTICLPLSTRCNGFSDCPGSTDEANCENICQHRHMLFCKNERRCIINKQACDGHPDCADGEDETPEFCKKVNRTTKLYPTVPVFPSEECHDGYWCSGGQCIEWSNVCDQRPDCADGSDEGGMCVTSCTNHNCSYKCQPTPMGHKCRCPAGHTLGADSVSCEDVDECLLGLCSQHCYNTLGSFVCSCHKGYALRPDRRSCKAVNGNVSLIYASGNTVRSMSLDGHFALEYRADDRIVDIDYDVRKKTLYVTSADKLTEVNGTHGKVQITNVGKPTLVSLDWITGNVYFAELSERAPRLRVCHVRKRRCATLQRLPLGSNVTSLVVDPASRKLFYSVSRDSECVIYASSLAGRRAAQVGVGGCGVAADTFAKRLYVADAARTRLYATDYHGNHHRDIIKDKEHLQAPHNLIHFEDHIYFLDGKSSKLSRCLLFGKKHCEMYFERVLEGSSLVINHESVQRNDIPDYCEGMPCDNLCVQGDLEGICLCDDGAVSKDGKCPLPAKEVLPLFNGSVNRSYQSSHVAIAIVITLFVLSVFCIAAFAYRRYRKKTTEEAADYLPVHFQNSMAEGTPPGGTSEESVAGAKPAPAAPSVQMPTSLPSTSAGGSSTNEFVNPLQFFRNWRPSFRKRTTRPVGTAGLEINVPPMDVSDTESDLDEREQKPTIVNT